MPYMITFCKKGKKAYLKLIRHSLIIAQISFPSQCYALILCRVLKNIFCSALILK